MDGLPVAKVWERGKAGVTLRTIPIKFTKVSGRRSEIEVMIMDEEDIEDDVSIREEGCISWVGGKSESKSTSDDRSMVLE